MSFLQAVGQYNLRLHGWSTPRMLGYKGTHCARVMEGSTVMVAMREGLTWADESTQRATEVWTMYNRARLR